MRATHEIRERAANTAASEPSAVLDHLDRLASQSVYILLEAHHAFSILCMPWSMGKDSNVLLWRAKKAFCGHVPFPVLHIDTTYEFPEMLDFRAWATEHY